MRPPLLRIRRVSRGLVRNTGWAFANKRRAGTGAQAFWIAPPEYVIVSKMNYYREGHSHKHLRDIRAIISTQGADLDRVTLAQWIVHEGLQITWEEAGLPKLSTSAQ